MKDQTALLPAVKRVTADVSLKRLDRRNSRPSSTARYLGVSLATLWRWSKERADMPKPRKHGPRVTCWDLNEIDAWLDAQQAK